MVKQIGRAVQHQMRPGAGQLRRLAKAAQDAHAPGPGAAARFHIDGGIADHDAFFDGDAQPLGGQPDRGRVGFEAARVLQAAGGGEHGRFLWKLGQKCVNVIPAARRHQGRFVPARQRLE